MTILGCPQEFCATVVSTIKLIDLFNKGLPPVAGGTLDQSAWFLDSVDVFAHEEASVKVAQYE